MAAVVSGLGSTTENTRQTQGTYDPATSKLLSYFDAVARFRTGEDDPRRYLDRCLETIAAREPLVKAVVQLGQRP